LEVEKQAMPTFKFTSVPSDVWIESNQQFVDTYAELGQISGQLKNASSEQVQSTLFDFGPYTEAKQMLDNGSIKTPPVYSGTIGFGYLPSDHDAPMFVVAKDWQYFNDHYGVTLKPKDPSAVKPTEFDLIVNNQKVADVRAVEGQGGAGLMTAMAQDAIQFSYSGTPPAILAIDKGAPIKILSPIHTEGSALVVGTDAPANDWNSFVQWAKQRSDAGKPLRIATGQGSIQDVILRAALHDAGINVKLVQT
ncbi:MAG TPA: ABC transporter substrate-binding protein, partial [Methanomicrobiales archaeon]|nr:ABC transporter substrate-binding protein [Methanomicrobiales archaeon]